jgi:hypothetical protein
MAINGHEILQYWTTNPDIRLYKKEEAPATPQWCEESSKLVTWGSELLLPWLVKHPKPETIAHAKSLLAERYWLLYHRVEDEHRQDERHAMHPCLHRAYMDLRDAIDDILFRVPIPELLPPPQVVHVPAPPVHRVIEAEEPFEELPGIIDTLEEFR